MTDQEARVWAHVYAVCLSNGPMRHALAAKEATEAVLAFRESLRELAAVRA